MASKTLTNQFSEYSCEMFTVILKWIIIFPNLQNGKQTPRPPEILQAAQAVKLFHVSIGSKLMLSTDSSSYLQINNSMSKDGHTGKQKPNYSILALPNTTYKRGYQRLLILALPILSLNPSMLKKMWLLSVMI